jgi:hypothetical protein
MATPVREVLPKLKNLMASNGLMPTGPELVPIPFEPFVEDFAPQWQDYLRSEFGYSQRLIDLLLAQKLIGSRFAPQVNRSYLVFPIADLMSGLVFRLEGYHLDAQNAISGPQYGGAKAYPITPLVVGNLKIAEQIHVHDSIWDMLAEIDAGDFYSLDSTAFVATRNADKAQLEHLVSILAPHAEIILWPRRCDQDGHFRRQWLDEILLAFKRRFLKVAWIPPLEPELDFGFSDWFRGYDIGATQVAQLIEQAVLMEPQPTNLENETAQRSKDDTQVDNDIKSFPVEALPSVLGNMAKAIAASVNVPLGLSAPVVLATICSKLVRRGTFVLKHELCLPRTNHQACSVLR